VQLVVIILAARAGAAVARWLRQPSVVGDAPEPREHHAACFVAERYLAIYGGFNETGDVLDSMAVYDIFTAEWSTVTGMAARAQHRLYERGGTLYAMGGVDASKQTASSIPLSAPMNLFSQQAFRGRKFCLCRW
jgi:hypothetical protein